MGEPNVEVGVLKRVLTTLLPFAVGMLLTTGSGLVAQALAAARTARGLPTFRRALHGALVATLYLDRHLDADTTADDAPDQQHALRLLDEIRDRYNPAVSWAGFVLELWARRREFRQAMEHRR